MEFQFTAEVWYWRGPAPYYFVSLPQDDAELVKPVANAVTYGWGMIPVYVQIRSTSWRTSMFAKHGGYVVPLRDSARKAEGIQDGESIDITVTVIGA